MRPQRLAPALVFAIHQVRPVYTLLRFSGSVVNDPGVTAWFAARDDELGALALKWFLRMRRCGDDVRELLHDGCPVVCVEDAPFGSVNAYRAHVNVGFFHGAALRDPERRLEGGGKYMRHVKLKPDSAPDDPALEALIAAAYLDIRARLEADRLARDDGRDQEHSSSEVGSS